MENDTQNSLKENSNTENLEMLLKHRECFNPFNPEFLKLQAEEVSCSYSRTCALSYGIVHSLILKIENLRYLP